MDNNTAKPATDTSPQCSGSVTNAIVAAVESGEWWGRVLIGALAEAERNAVMVDKLRASNRRLRKRLKESRNTGSEPRRKE